MASLFARDLAGSYKRAQKKAKGDSFGKQLAKGVATGLVTGLTTELGKQVIATPAAVAAAQEKVKETEFLETQELRDMRMVNNQVNETMKTITGIENSAKRNLMSREEAISLSPLVTDPINRRLEEVMTKNGLNYAALSDTQIHALTRNERMGLAKLIGPTYNNLLELGQNVRTADEHKQFKLNAYNDRRGILNQAKDFVKEKLTGVDSITKSIEELQQDKRYQDSVSFKNAYNNYTADKDVTKFLSTLETIDIKERIKNTPGLEVRKIEKSFQKIADITYPVKKITVVNKATDETTIQTVIDKGAGITNFSNKETLKNAEKPSALISAFDFSDGAERKLLKRLATITAKNRVTGKQEVYDYNNPDFFDGADGLAAYQETLNVIRSFGVNPANRKDISKLRAEYLNDHLQNQYRHSEIWHEIEPLFVEAPADKNSLAYKEWAKKIQKANDSAQAISNAFQINNDILVGIDIGAIGLVDATETIQIPDDEGGFRDYTIKQKRSAPVGAASYDGKDNDGNEMFTRKAGISDAAWEDSLNAYRRFNLDDLVGMDEDFYNEISNVITGPEEPPVVVPPEVITQAGGLNRPIVTTEDIASATGEEIRQRLINRAGTP